MSNNPIDLTSALAPQRTDFALPSPWASANGASSPAAPSSSSTSSTPAGDFMQALAQARSGVAAPSSLAASAAVPAVASAQATHLSGNGPGLSSNFGLPALESMGKRLSKGDADLYQSVMNLDNLDVSSPTLAADLLSVSLMSAKAGITNTLAMKFASKINDSINTLLKST